MRNPHGVPPTRYMKRQENKRAINCNPSRGPTFGRGDIFINDDCTKDRSCWIDNNGNLGYACHPKYKQSLYVNSGKPDEKNRFTVLDYEVFSYI